MLGAWKVMGGPLGVEGSFVATSSPMVARVTPATRVIGLAVTAQCRVMSSSVRGAMVRVTMASMGGVVMAVMRVSVGWVASSAGGVDDRGQQHHGNKQQHCRFHLAFGVVRAAATWK